MLFMDGRVTIRGVAAHAGVSVATVSKVLNERWGVAPETRDRVRTAIQQLGYQASLVAQGLASGRTGVVGILVADFGSFAAELVQGAVEALHGNEYELVVYSACKSGAEAAGWERRYLSRLAGTIIDGAILVTPTIESVEHGPPVVAVDPLTRQSEMPTVFSDNLRGAVLAVEHLLALGHRRIGHVAGRAGLQSAALRMQGYRDALERAGIPVDESLIRPGGYTSTAALASARELLTAAEPPTAIFAAGDRSALATYKCAAELGIRIPDQLSVVGFNNIPESALVHPGLTTVAQAIRDMGKTAVETLLATIAKQPVAQVAVVPTQLIVRGSTAPPKPARATTKSPPIPRPRAVQ
jgi:LacI family transcriptional regulator